MGQIMDNNVRKDQNPNCCFQKNQKAKAMFWEQKIGYCISSTLSTTKGQAIYANTSASFFDTLSSCHIGTRLSFLPQGAAKSKQLFILSHP